MTREEFFEQTSALLRHYLKPEVVDSVIETVMNETWPEEYEAKLEAMRRSFDWSVPD